MVTTADPALAGRVRRLRNHGIDTDFRTREQRGTWEYDVVELGLNYRLPDLNCALGASQVAKVPGWVERRRAIAARYVERLAGLPLQVLTHPEDREPSWHLFPVLVDPGAVVDRDGLVARLREEGIGANVHYRPVHLHTLYAADARHQGPLPVAEDAGRRVLTLPLWHGMTDGEQDRVIDTLTRILRP